MNVFVYVYTYFVCVCICVNMYECGCWWICVVRGEDMGECVCMRGSMIKSIEGPREDEVTGEIRCNREG